MFRRHAFLGLALAATGLLVGGATLFAGEESDARPLHAARGGAAQHRTPVVIDRTRALRRVDRLLEDLREVARTSRAPRPIVSIEVGRQRTLRGEVDGEKHADTEPLRHERGGSAPVHREEVEHRHRSGDGDRDAELERRIQRMKRDLRALHEDLRMAPIVAPAPIEVIRPVSERAFREYLRAVRKPHWDDDRMEVLRDILRHVYFTAAQAAEIVDHGFRFDDHKAALLLYPRIVDKQHMHLVYEAIRWDSDRDALRRAIRKLER